MGYFDSYLPAGQTSSARFAKRVMQPSYYGGTGASVAGQRQAPERLDLSNLLIEGIGRAAVTPAYVYERPFALANQLTKFGGEKGLVDQAGDFIRSVPVVGGIADVAGKGLEASSKLMPTAINGGDVRWLVDTANLPDDAPMPFKPNPWAGTALGVLSGLLPGTKTVGEFRQQMFARGFTWQDIQDVRAGKRGLLDFGDRAIDQNRLMDFGGRLALDPLNLVIGTGVITKGAQLSAKMLGLLGASTAATRAVNMTKPALSVMEGIGALKAGVIDGVTKHSFSLFLEGLGRGTAPVLRTWRRVGLGVTIPQVGVNIADELVPDNWSLPGPMESLFELGRDMDKDRPLSTNTLFTLWAVLHFPARGMIGAVTEKGKIKYYQKASVDIEARLMDRLAAHLPVAQRRQYVLDRMGGEEGWLDFMAHIVGRVATDRMISGGISQAQMVVRANTFAETLAHAAHMNGLVAGAVRTGFQKGRITGRDAVRALEDWTTGARKIGDLTGGMDLKFDPEMAFVAWSEWRPMAAHLSSLYGKGAPIVAGINEQLSKEAIQWLRARMSQVADDAGMVHPGEAQRILMGYPAVFKHENATKGTLARLLGRDAEMTPLKWIDQRLRAIEKDAPTLRELLAPVEQYEARAGRRAAKLNSIMDPETGRPDPALVPQMGNAEVRVQSARTLVGERTGFPVETIEHVQALRSRPGVRAVEEDIADALEEAGYGVDAAVQGIMLDRRAMSPGIAIRIDPRADPQTLAEVAQLGIEAANADHGVIMYRGPDIARQGLTPNAVEFRWDIPGSTAEQSAAASRAVRLAFGEDGWVNDTSGIIQITVREGMDPVAFQRKMRTLTSRLAAQYPDRAVNGHFRPEQQPLWVQTIRNDARRLRRGRTEADRTTGDIAYLGARSHRWHVARSALAQSAERRLAASVGRPDVMAPPAGGPGGGSPGAPGGPGGSGGPHPDVPAGVAPDFWALPEAERAAFAESLKAEGKLFHGSYADPTLGRASPGDESGFFTGDDFEGATFYARSAQRNEVPDAGTVYVADPPANLARLGTPEARPIVDRALAEARALYDSMDTEWSDFGRGFPPPFGLRREIDRLATATEARDVDSALRALAMEVSKARGAEGFGSTKDLSRWVREAGFDAFETVETAPGTTRQMRVVVYADRPPLRRIDDLYAERHAPVTNGQVRAAAEAGDAEMMRALNLRAEAERVNMPNTGTPEFERLRAEMRAERSPDVIPPTPPGETPMGSGYVRGYHYTRSDAELASILRDGLDVSYARGHTYGEPDQIWFSTKKPGADRSYVEAWIRPEEMAVGGPSRGTMTQAELDAFNSGDHNFTVGGSHVDTGRIVSYHAPWHSRYGYFKRNFPPDDPASWSTGGESVADVVARYRPGHPYRDSIIAAEPDYGPAMDAWLADIDRAGVGRPPAPPPPTDPVRATDAATNPGNTGAVTFLIDRDAEVAMFKPNFDPALEKFLPEEELAKLYALEREVRLFNPAYRMKVLPGIEKMTMDATGRPSTPYYIGQGHALMDMVAGRQAAVESLKYRRLSKVANLWDSIVGRVYTARLARDQKQEIYSEFLKHGATVADVNRFIGSLETYAEFALLFGKTKQWRRADMLPPETIDALARGDFGIFDQATIKAWAARDGRMPTAPFSAEVIRSVGRTGFHKALDRSASRFYRKLAQKYRASDGQGSLGKLLDLYYGTQGGKLGSAGHYIRSWYHIFRFLIDPRYHLYNRYEADILGYARSGFSATRFGGANEVKMVERLDSRGRLIEEVPTFAAVNRAAKAHTPGAPAERNLGIGDVGRTDPLGDSLASGYLDTRRLEGNISRSFDVERVESTREALMALATDDPIIVLARQRWGESPEQWVAGLDKMMYDFDVRGVAKSIEDEARNTFEAIDYAVMEPIITRLQERHASIFRDVVHMYHGNTNRSNLERVLNSYFLYWPISYQLKAGKVLFDVLTKRSVGHKTDLLGAWTIDRLYKEHLRRLTVDDGYRKMFDENPDVWRAAAMLLPITPFDAGVMLSRFTRYGGSALGAWAGLWPQDERYPDDPIEFGARIMEIGPTFTASLLLDAADELDIELPRLSGQE